jgi:hypothetical protein
MFTFEQAIIIMREQRKLRESKIQHYKDVLLPAYHRTYMEARKNMSLHERGMKKERRYSEMADLWTSLNKTYSTLSKAITAYRKLRTELNALGREIRKYEEIMESSAVRGRQI